MTESLKWALDRSALIASDRTAVVDGDVRYDYAELARRVTGLGGGLQGLGIAKGDVVGVLALNGRRHLDHWLAVPAIGAVLNDLNFRLSEEELAFILDDCRTVALAVDDTHLEIGARLRERCPTLTTLVHMGDGPAPDGFVSHDELLEHSPATEVSISPEDVAGIFYTGGTTGRPKGVLLSHRNLVANAKQALLSIRHTAEERYLHAGPMFHLADGSQTYAVTWIGGVHVFVPGFDADLVGRVIERERVTLLLIVPSMINMLVNHPGTAERDLSSLRLLLYGASPMPDQLQQAAMKLLSCEFSQLYGMTEAAPLLTQSTPEDHRRGAAGEEPFARRLRSAGAPVIGVQVEVRREDGTRAAPGEVGEIWARGPNIMMGYLNRPEETAAALDADGWYHSGDAAWADEHGYIYIVDRVKDMIISGGENVYSAEVENVLYTHPDVLEAAVIGVPDDSWGERVHAIVVPRPGSEPAVADLVAHCRSSLGGFKIPRSVDFRFEALPKSGAGKILKRELREPYWSDKDRGVN
ncbi:long-chain-fatty-acid--CoA ligase [Pseudonocardia sp. WMMC193]|uniref:long-chain-fatty-acid--CoA ligase n=1 Tax=Pseudonocardia sp. WMMC193 TaxID=2911965 RepID=UPI001F30C42E|nr:long-chain-fatty-acid--CoA ligase [Pseudonocardia sp. WMMC193]MCF7550804.1 long-chain-fatty-acid--CoA ligase [Pseudonocardia sp. WMMC193]